MMTAAETTILGTGLRTPPPMVRGAAPAIPARIRKAMSMPMEVLNAHAIVKITKNTWPAEVELAPGKVVASGIVDV